MRATAGVILFPMNTQFATGDALARRFWNLHAKIGIQSLALRAIVAARSSWESIRPLLLDFGFVQEMRSDPHGPGCRRCIVAERLMWTRHCLRIDVLEPDIEIVYDTIRFHGGWGHEYIAFLARYAPPGPWDAPIDDDSWQQEQK